ncbi:MAG: class I SAM-dependent methyltransferase [Cyanobacteria bacterium P01_E01_bin.6]
MNSPKGFASNQSQPSKQTKQAKRSGRNLAPYVRTLPIVIDAMLEAGNVTATDYIYDLGCGDGRILLTAAQRCGARGLGIDLDPERIQEAKAAARQLGLIPHIRFKHQDLLKVDLSTATVVTLYLLPESNLRLRHKLQTELKPGSRIITHSFDMGDWLPTRTAQVSDVINTYTIYVWEI